MAEVIVVSCPECDRQMKAPADGVGKKIRCKGCGHGFVIKSPAAAKSTATSKTKSPAKSPPPPKKPAKPQPQKPARPAIDDEDDPNPYELTHLDLTPRCPHCAGEMESEDSVVCLNCGYNTRTREMGRTRKIVHATGGDVFLWLLPGILAALGILAMIGYAIFHYFALPGILIDNWDTIIAKYDGRIDMCKKDEEVGFLAKAAVHPAIFTIFVFLPSCWAGWKMGRFAFIRLIMDNKPPEVEKQHA